jgi:hypothetical protein
LEYQERSNVRLTLYPQIFKNYILVIISARIFYK